jgi:hypothetical protein
MSQSKTVKVNLGVVVSCMVTLILYYTDAIMVGTEALSMCWTAIIMGTLNFLLRMMTTQPLGPTPPRRGRGSSLMVVFCLLGVVIGPWAGCGTTYRCKRSEQTTKRLPSGKVETVISCDQDNKAVVITIDEFTKLTTKGLICTKPEEE